MSISAKVKALLALCGKKQSSLMEALNMGSKQSMSNKFTNDRWSADDLVKVAEVCGVKLAFEFPDGQLLYIDNDA